MIKKVFGILTATALALATLGAGTPAYAITSDDVEQLQIAGNTGGAEAVVTVIAALDGEVAVVVYEGDAAKRFDEAIYMYAGIKAPEETFGFVFGATDPSDNTVLLIVYAEDGSILGGAWVEASIVDAAKDYVRAGV